MLAFLLLVAPGLIRAQQTPQILHNHLRAEVTQGTAPLVGPMPAGQRMRLSIVLPLRNQADLKNLLARLYDPSSPDYRHFLTVDEFTQRYGPTADDYRVVVAFAQANGLTVTGTPPNRLIVPVSGTVDQVERAFNVQMNVYQHPAENRTFFSPDREPSLNLSLPIAHISGLNDFTLPRPMVVSPQQGPILSSQLGADANGSGPDGSYLASDMRGAYYGGATLDGTGQTVGLLEFDGYDPNDVTETFAGQSYTVPINNVLLDGATGAPVSGITNGEAEVVLDIVQAIGMAPGLSQVRVYIGQPTDDATILNKMATENIAKQISCSWSWGPDDPGADDPFFEEFAAQGQSFFTASGDSGAYPSPSIPYYYPAEDDFVTAVGGTDLTTVSAGGAWSSEMAWSDSGGGVSPDSISIPGWQSGVADAANGGSTTLRNVPDVAMEANFDNYVCSLGSCQVGWGGTSFAAPRWAAFMALINQQAVEAGTAPMGGLGFLDPSLYALAGGSSYGNDLHDIISGNNNYGDTPTWYNAVAGYDLVTGWGSPNGANLINGLAGPQVPGFWLRPSVASLQVGSGTAGASTTIGITDAGGFTGGVNLAVSSPLPAGVTASWGTNPASGSSVLTLAAASDAPAANANLTITGTAGQLTASATVAVSVHAPTFLLTATPNAVSVSLSSPATTTVLVTPQYGFTGSVNLSVSGLPSGVTASFSPNPTNGSSTLTLTAAANAPSGTVTATLKGASGSVTASATFSLTVLAPFVIVSPTNVSLGEGGSAATAVGVNSLGFTGSVNLSLSGLPAGVTGTFATNPLPVTSNTLTSSQLTLTATSTAVLGQYTLTVTGTSGALSASNTFTLAITAPKSVATVTVSPSSSSIATSQSLPVSVSVSGNGGELVAAGSVSLSSGSYTSGSATLIDGSAIITIPAGALSAGSDTVTVSYSGDSIYNPATASTTVTATAFPPINPAQTAVNLGTINVGSTSSSPTSITFDFTAPVSVGSTAVVTQGAQGLDFIDAGGGTCDTNGGNHVYKAGDTCTVNVTFAPNYPGARNGAVNLINSGIVIATALIYGIGDGAQLTFQSPNSQSTIATGVGLPGGVAVDGGGNVYFTNNSQPYQLFRATPSNGSYVVSVIPTSALLDPRGIAVDGAGNIYIADDNWRVLKETATASGYTESTVASFPVIGGAFPVGFAVDGAGNVYVSLGAAAGTVYKESLTASGYVQSTVVSGLPANAGIAVDGNGNVYIIVNEEPGWIVKATPSGNGYTQRTIPVTGDGVPSAVAVDASGSIYVAFTDNNDIGQVFKETSQNGSYIQTTISTSGLNQPSGVALDSSGNVYVADYAMDRIVKETLATPPSLTFAATPIRSRSSDSPQTVALNNIGNAPLTFLVPPSGENPSVSASFMLDSSTTCPEVLSSSSAGTLAAGATCSVAVDFVPVTSGPITGALVVADNNLNIANGTQSINLSGTGVATSLTTPAVTVTPAHSQINLAQSLQVTIAVSGGNGNPTPTGSVTLSSGSYTSAVTALTSGSTTINLPAGQLAVGNDTLTAAYTPDSGGSSTYTRATGTAPMTVVRAIGSCATSNPNPNPNPESFAAAGDFNGDCRSDILWRNTSTGQLYTWLMNGTSILTNQSPGSSTSDWVVQGVGDFNGDGYADILWRNSTTGQVYVWFMNGTTVTSSQSPGSSTSDWVIQGIGDFNGDGKADILWRNSTTGQVYIWFMNGATITSNQSPGSPTTDWVIQGVGDFNGDGMADILWRNSNSGQVYIWLMNGATITSSQSPGSPASVWSIQGVGDFDGNGTSDILWRNSSTGQVYIWFMNGSTITSSQTPGSPTTDWVFEGVGDYDGSGRAGILWRNSNSEQVYIWLMNGATVTNNQSLGSPAASWHVTP